jgi:hypothetical protein
LIGFEGYENLTLSRARSWVSAYKWPIYYFVAVAFWNLVGAGLFGFLINPPIGLYYMQGLNTTPVHAHTALFGVYGMLGIGLMLFCLRGLTRQEIWKSRALWFSFWSMNIGLALGGIPTNRPHGEVALATGDRRHDLRIWRRQFGLVRAGTQNRLVVGLHKGNGEEIRNSFARFVSRHCRFEVVAVLTEISISFRTGNRRRTTERCRAALEEKSSKFEQPFISLGCFKTHQWPNQLPGEWKNSGPKVIW